MKNYIYLFLVLFSLSCQKHTQYVKPDDNKKIEGFFFLKEDNEGLLQDISGRIDQGDIPYIEVVIPRTVNIKRLVPTVVYKGDRLQPNLISNGVKRLFDFSVGIINFVVINGTDYSSIDQKSSAMYAIDVHYENTPSNQQIEDQASTDAGNQSGGDNGQVETPIVIERPDVAIGDPITLAYFPSWSESWAGPGENSKLRETPKYVNTIFFSFAKPNLRYKKGSYDIDVVRTGIQVPYDGPALLETIKVLKSKGIKVILSLGGETYWPGAIPSRPNAECYDIDYQQIKDIVDDFGFAGIDWDYEPDGQISPLGQKFHVDKFIEFITKSRNLMPKSEGYIIAAAPSGVGALGGRFNDDPASPYKNANFINFGGSNQHSNAAMVSADPATLFGFESTGHFIPVMSAVGDKIDLVAYQGYNVGGSTDRKVMYDAYAYYANRYGFVVTAGVHVANEPWGPYYYFDNNNVGDLAKYIYDGGRESRAGKNDGIMLWELLARDESVRKNSGYEFSKLSLDILKGMSKDQAIANVKASATKEPYSGGSEVSVSVGNSSAQGTKHCDVYAWDNTTTYPKAGEKVYHKGFIYESKWWTQGNEPGTEVNEWDSPWKKLQPCSN